MWISKSKWNEMCDKVSSNDVSFLTRDEYLKKLEGRLTKAEEMINELKLIHNETTEEVSYFDINNFMAGKSGVVNKKVQNYSHIPESTSTKLIPKVTLEELAKLVIDGEPIKRIKKIDMTTEFHGRV